MSESRCDTYRDLLETWADWWDGPGRRGYEGNCLPPITRTGEALACLICVGVEIEGRCAACGRRGTR